MDCEVYQGRSTITVEHLTGEVKPIERKTGDSIPGGARNLDGMMIVRVRIFCLPTLIKFCIREIWKKMQISYVPIR